MTANNFPAIHGHNVFPAAIFNGSVTFEAARADAPKLSTEEQNNQYLETCENSLDPPLVDDKFHALHSFSAADWLFRQEAFAEWETLGEMQKRERSLLTIKGNPFTGKSAMVKRAVDRSLGNPNTITLHHFFGGGSSGTATFLRKLLAQLLGQVPDIPWEQVRRWANDISDENDAELYYPEKLQTAIEKIILKNGQVLASKGIGIRIFVDGIDECTEKQQGHQGHQPPLLILQFLGNLLNSALSAGINIGVCVSRRSLTEYGGHEPPAKEIDLQEYVDAEVPKFLAEQLKALEDEDKQFHLLRRLLKNGSNNFLWADVRSRQIIGLKGASNDKSMFDLAEKVLESDEDLYRSALLSAMAEYSHDQLLRLLKIGLGTFRALTVDEFHHAYAFAAAPNFEFQHKDMLEWEKSEQGLSPVKFKKYVGRASGGLLNVVARRKRPVYNRAPTAATDGGHEHRVLFIDGSVAQFLHGKAGHSELRVDATSTLEQECHLLLFKTCMSVLDYCDLSGDDDVQVLDYACEFWLRHAQKCGKLDHGCKLPRFVSSCKNKKAPRFIKHQIKSLERSQAMEIGLLDDETTMMILLSTMGCTSLLSKHLEKCKTCQGDIKPVPSDAYWTSIMNATIGRHHDTALYLLNSCPKEDVNNLIGNETLLYKACYFSSWSEGSDMTQRMRLVKTLLSRGADASVACHTLYEYPLHMAIALNNHALIEELLAEPARKEALFTAKQQATGWTAIHFAIQSPRPNIMERFAMLAALLDHAPKSLGLLNEVDNDGKTPMTLALETIGKDGRRIVELLEEFEEED